MELAWTPDPTLRRPLVDPNLPAPEITPTTYRYVDTKTHAWVELERDPATSQWKHPKRHYVICGARNTTYNSAGIPDPATAPLCMVPAGSNTGHRGIGQCERHGGAQDTKVKGGVAILREMRTRQQMTMLGIPLDVKPVDALLHLVSEAAGNVAFLGGRVAELGFDLVGSVYSLSRDGTPVETSEDVRAIVKLYNEERDRLMKVSKVAIDAGIAEREVRLLEDQATLVAGVFRTVLSQLGLPADVQTNAMQLLGREFRRLDAITVEGTAVEL